MEGNVAQSNQCPVILNEHLQHLDINRLLHYQQFKVRVSGATLKDTIIFPRSGVAFLIISLQQQHDVENIHQLIEKMLQVHRTSYLLCMAAIHGQSEQKTFIEIQTRYLASSLNMLPVHTSTECVSVMKTIARMTCKPNCDVISGKLSSALTRLRDVEGRLLSTLVSTGVEERVCGYLLDNLGSISGVATADRNQLLEASCYDSMSADTLTEFFNKDQLN